MQEVQIRNTFIEVHSSDEDDDDGLPRSTSDQTHARKHPIKKVVVAPTIQSIPEDEEIDNNNLNRTKAAIIKDNNILPPVPPSNPAVGSSVNGIPAYNSYDNYYIQGQDGGYNDNRYINNDIYNNTGYYFNQQQVQQHVQEEDHHRAQNRQEEYYHNHNRGQSSYYHHNNNRDRRHMVEYNIEEVNVGRHCWHIDAETMGTLSDDLKTFTKLQYEGRLSMVTEEQIRRHGVHRYMVSFDKGEISPADGVGYAFSSQLPCKKNIQKIDSIFLNRRGHICSRTHSDVSRRHAFVAPLEEGRVVDLTVDVDRCLIYFGVWSPPPTLQRPDKLTPDYVINNYHLLACSTVEFGDVASTCRYGSTGHFCTVLKNTNVTVSFICPDVKK